MRATGSRTRQGWIAPIATTVLAGAAALALPAPGRAAEPVAFEANGGAIDVLPRGAVYSRSRERNVEEIVLRRPDGRVRSLARLRVSLEPPPGCERFHFGEWQASTRGLAVLRGWTDECFDPQDRFVLRFGRPGDRGRPLVDCRLRGARADRFEFDETPLVSVDGDRVAWLAPGCPRTTAVRVGRAGRVELEVPVEGLVTVLRLAGDQLLVADREGERLRRLDASDGTPLATYEVRRGIAQADLQADGTAAWVDGSFVDPCELVIARPGAPVVRRSGALDCAIGAVALDGEGRVVLADDVSGLRTLSSDGTRVRELGPFPFQNFSDSLGGASLDADHGRIGAVTEYCGLSAVWTFAGDGREGGTSRPASCPARVTRRRLTFRDGRATLHVRCPNGCVRDVRLRIGRREVAESVASVLPGTTRRVPLRLRRGVTLRDSSRGTVVIEGQDFGDDPTTTSVTVAVGREAGRGRRAAARGRAR